MPIDLHQDADLFREALAFTAAETGFAPRLIEKDYFCTVVLQYLAAAETDLVFRGGTCLAKVHVGFYRLSEDIDFLISTPVDASRSERRGRVQRTKDALTLIDQRVAGIRKVTSLTGANDSRQYIAVLGYNSLLGDQEETIKLDVGLREPRLTAAIDGEARTLLLDPVSNAPMAPVVSVPCVSRLEAWAEKIRAALSRRDVAIRDFYDIDHAVRRTGLRLDDAELLALVRQKLAIPQNDAVDVTGARLNALRPQIEAQLKPVLRNQDFVEFGLERAFATVARLAEALA